MYNMINIINTTVHYMFSYVMWKSFRQKEKICFPLIFYEHEMMNVH